MERAQKAEAVDVLKGIFTDSGVVVVTHYEGLTVAEMTVLRGRLRDANAKLKVVKNRFAKIALQGTPGEGVSDLFTGPVAIAYSADPVAAPKAAVEFAKLNNKLVVIGGMMGAQIFDASGIVALSKMPSREEMIATIALRLTSQASQVVQRLNAPGQALAGAIKVIGEKAAA